MKAISSEMSSFASLLSVDPTDPRTATVRRFGRSDRSSLAPGDGIPDQRRVKVRGI
jgi:hypothetical protein